MTVQEFITWFDDVMLPTEQMLRMVPHHQLDWTLTPTSFTLGQLTAHIAGAPGFFAKVLKGDEPPMRSMREILVANRSQQPATPEEAAQLYRNSVSDFRAAVLSFSDEEFRTRMIDTPQKGRMLVWRYAVFAIEHHIHHLMELHLNLKALGVKVHTGSLYVK